MLATACQFSAEEALQARFVNRLVPRAQLEPAVRDMAARQQRPLPLAEVVAEVRRLTGGGAR